MNTQIRLIRTDDAQAYSDLLTQLDTESDFLLFEPGERTTTPEQWRAMLAEMLENGTSAIFVAESESELVGFVRVRGDNLRRLRHSALIVIAIKQAFTGQGVGTALLSEAERWARERGVHRLYLTVMTHNERAIGLYQKMGFVFEGFHRHTLVVDGHFVDEYTMAKLLN